MPISSAEAMHLLAGAAYGRVVSTRDAMPSVRPVNHLVEAGMIIIRAQLTVRVTSTVHERSHIVVAYQADDIDPVRRAGWSVVVTGLAHAVTNPDRIARYETMLEPWTDGDMDVVVEIEPSIITGIRLRGDLVSDPAALP